jgi:hypothetical protein
MSIDWNDPRRTGAAPSVSNMQTITVTSAPPIDWQARATAAEAENAKLRDALRFYADRKGYAPTGPSKHFPLADDEGNTARQALQETTDAG